jgi:UDP:flavonoid glycosyltransferase YjiC (YdhE family)
LARLGLGVGLGLGLGTERGVFAAVQQLLTKPEYRERAKAFQKKLEAMPGVERAVALVEELAQRGGNSVKPKRLT